jgi:transcriptional regulator with XRE-family HTH domain
MPASKRSHVLALLRAKLNLKQTELARLANCSVATIQPVELGRLELSESLAGRISAVTGADLDWLRANDLKRPLPPIRALTLTSELINRFKELFRYARLTVKGSERESLALYIAWELNRLKSAPAKLPELTPEEERELEELDREWEQEQAAKATPKPLKDRASVSPVSGKALALPAPKARRRNRRST